MTRRARGIAAASLAAALLAIPVAGSTHASLLGSDPSTRQRLGSPPSEVTLRFSEGVDPRLSRIEVLDAAGENEAIGEPSHTDSDATLRVAVEDLSIGTYLVSWRAFSAVDGHLTAGSFVFGVGQDPSVIALPDQEITDPSLLAVAGRGIFLMGLALAIGSVAVGLMGSGAESVARSLFAGLAIAFVGVAMFGHAQRVASEVSFGTFLSTGIGRAVLFRIGFLALAAALMRFVRRSRLALTGAALVAVVVAHVASGHAATGGAQQIALQVAHVLAIGTWAGGLIPLVVNLAHGEAGSRLARRFSAIAPIFVVIVVGTGSARTLAELPFLAAIDDDAYGRSILVKVGLLLAILVIATVSRFRFVRTVRTDARALRSALKVEAGFVVLVLATTGFLANLAPSRSQGTAVAPSVATTASSFDGDVSVAFRASPGLPGANLFVVHPTNRLEDERIVGATVSARLRYRGRGEAIPIDVAFREAQPGEYRADSTIPFAGPYEVTVRIQTATGSSEILLAFGTQTTQDLVTQGADPPIHTITFVDGSSVQLYLDPGAVGNNEMHATFFDADGTEATVAEPAFVATTMTGVRPLVVRALSSGHLVASVTLDEGEWRFDASAIVAARSRTAWFTQDIEA